MSHIVHKTVNGVDYAFEFNINLDIAPVLTPELGELLMTLEEPERAALIKEVAFQALAEYMAQLAKATNQDLSVEDIKRELSRAEDDNAADN